MIGLHQDFLQEDGSRMAISPGLAGKKTIRVKNEDTAPHVPVFSTPSLVQLFEQTCTSAIKDHLPPDTTHVGFEVNIRHLAPVPVGGEVVANVEVTEAKGNKIYFKLVAHHGATKIGDGTYSCAVVSASFEGK